MIFALAPAPALAPASAPALAPAFAPALRFIQGVFQSCVMLDKIQSPICTFDRT